MVNYAPAPEQVIKDLLPFQAREGTRHLNHVYFIDGCLVASDGCRLAAARCPGGEAFSNNAKEPDTVKKFQDEWIPYFFTRAYEGLYFLEGPLLGLPKWPVSVEARALKEALTTIKKNAGAENKYELFVWFVIRDGSITLQPGYTDEGSIVIDATTPGKGVVGLQVQYLLDTIAFLNTKHLVFAFDPTDQRGRLACYIDNRLPYGQDGYRGVFLLPIRSSTKEAPQP